MCAIWYTCFSVAIHLSCAGFLVMSLFIIYCWVWWWKSYENQSAFGKVIIFTYCKWSFWPRYCPSPCICLHIMAFRCRILVLIRTLEASCLLSLSDGIHRFANLNLLVPMDCFGGTVYFEKKTLMYFTVGLTVACINYF